MKTKNQILGDLLQGVIDQAKYFLREHLEFYPVSVALNNKNKIQAIALYEGEDKPKTSEYLKRLEKFLETEYDSFGIGVNVQIQNADHDKPIDAIEIKLWYKGENYQSCFLPYQFNANGSIEYGELYSY
ncbi:hypothetical protein QQ020_28105 [Fulvivirgaceae bacterium BMA12]|uniref:Uncharacterized protein n=1 Tax=Agaribacillus aureus TaxID=3051825 RepID=A0ABT8LDY1_9BACT|nr:hypothetical protein [Fulvivirgaceae bacterium BMA12]